MFSPDKNVAEILKEHEERLSKVERGAKSWKASEFKVSFSGMLCGLIIIRLIEWIGSTLF